MQRYINTGECYASVNTWERHAYVNTRERHACVNTGESHSYVNTGERCTYLNTNEQYAYVNIGQRCAYVNTGGMLRPCKYWGKLTLYLHAVIVTVPSCYPFGGERNVLSWSTALYNTCPKLELVRVFKFLLVVEVSKNLGPNVQNVVSLTSSIRIISLTVLADSIYNILIFFAEKM